MKCFMSQHLVSCDGGSVDRAKKKKKEKEEIVFQFTFCILNLTFNLRDM